MPIRPARRPIDGGGASGLACRSPGPARSTREEAAHVHCGIGYSGGRCLSRAVMSRGRAATRGDDCYRRGLMLAILILPYQGPPYHGPPHG